MDEAVFHPLPRSGGQGLLIGIRIPALPARMQAHPAHCLYLLTSYYKMLLDATRPHPQQSRSPSRIRAPFRHASMSLGASFWILPARFGHERGTVWARFFISTLRPNFPPPTPIPLSRRNLRPHAPTPHASHPPPNPQSLPPRPMPRRSPVASMPVPVRFRVSSMSLFVGSMSVSRRFYVGFSSGVCDQSSARPNRVRSANRSRGR